MRKEVLAALREVRIFQFAQTQARQIIAELESSNGEHTEDIDELYGLIEVWAHLQEQAAYDAQEAELREVEGA